MNRDEFYTAFKHDIITSKLKPGELLKEKQIMQDYGIGRLPMREIMVRLQQENLIETIPRMGTVVTRLDIKHMRDVVELRLELECVVAKLAAERITGRTAWEAAGTRRKNPFLRRRQERCGGRVGCAIPSAPV